MPVNVATALRDALVTNLTAAVDAALREVFSLDTSPAPSTAPAKRGPGRPRAVAAAKLRRQQKEVTRWSPNKQARRVPLFVQQVTGFELKADVAKKYGEDALFVKGKPAPKPLAGPGVNATNAAPVKAKAVETSKKKVASKKKPTKKAA